MCPRRTLFAAALALGAVQTACTAEIAVTVTFESEPIRKSVTEVKTFVAIHGHLESPAPDLQAGMSVRPGATIGFVGDSGALGVVHLHYEVRLMRAGVDPMRVDPPQHLSHQDVSIPCDPRNVLPFQ